MAEHQNHLGKKIKQINPIEAQAKQKSLRVRLRCQYKKNTSEYNEQSGLRTANSD